VVSKDLMPNVRRKDERQARLVGEALARGEDVVVDNTNLTAASRAPLIALARGLGARVVGYWFTAPPAECLARNQARSGRARVPAGVIWGMARKVEPPRQTEGFDALYTVRSAVGGGFTIAPL
jgi:predicted kinase